MWKAMRTFVVLMVLAAAMSAAWLMSLGCSSGARSFSRRAAEAPSAVPKAHGGTANVNDAAEDAMFFQNYGVNPFVDTDDDLLSTFAVDVDTGSYTLCRSYLDRGNLPPKDAVRVEEFVNYFHYDYSPPAAEGEAFAVHLEAAPSPFTADAAKSASPRLLLRVGLKAYEVDAADRKPAVLTFVIDVSGSMDREDRLGLVKKSLNLLVDQLQEGDQVGIAIYGSSGKKLLDYCGVEDRQKIRRAIGRLGPGGSTNAEEGLRIGYEMADEAFQPGAINRIILCSDGVANVGNTGPDSILEVIRKHVERGITLSAVGFGMGNYNDVLLEQLGDKGNGHYAYVDTLDEARRVFVDNLTGTLQVVARDAKVQVEFDPQVVRSYRLIGYENRDVADKDFRNDKVDGGEVGAGHAVTALYEVKLWPEKQGRLAAVRVRYKDAEDGKVREITRRIATSNVADSYEAASASFRLAVCAAEFAEILRKSYWARGCSLDDVLALAKQSEEDYDRDAEVGGLVRLVKKARSLSAEESGENVSSLEE